MTVKLFGMSPGTYFGADPGLPRLRSTSGSGSGRRSSSGSSSPWVACYKGFHVGHGAEGVGRATTEAVVLASVLILVLDYFLGSVLP